MMMKSVLSVAIPALLLLLSGVPGSEAVATVQVNKDSYCRGDSITVVFDGVEGQGVWIGVFSRADVNDISALPDWTSMKLKGWILTCGHRSDDGCAEWPSTGKVELETDELVDDNYVVVVSGDRASLSAQASTDPFEVSSCSDPTPTNPPTRFPTAAPIAPTPAPGPIDDGGVEGGVRVVTDPNIFATIQAARGQINGLIQADNDLIGKFLRLVFHDCVGGCDGCVDMTNGSHAGLAKPIEVLRPIVAQFADQGLTRTDIWMLSALVATEFARPSDMLDISFDLQFIGRKTCEELGNCGNDSTGAATSCTEMRGPHVEMCHGGAGTTTMRNFFINEFRLNDQQITAIMGAHSVGGMHRENSGHTGNWDLSSTSLDAGYWIELIGNPPNFFIEEVDNSDLGKPNSRQWLGILNPQSSVVMLNTDMALVRNIPDMEAGINCDFTGPNACSQDTPFMPHVQRYLADTRGFLHDFRDVMNILIDHGHEKPGACPAGSICTFGFEADGSIETEPEPVTPPTPAPVAPPTFPAPADGAASIRVDKTCYNEGETIVASYENISGAGVWIGIFPADMITDFTNLPPFESEDLLEWNFLCGFEKCHTWTPLGGADLSTDSLTPGRFAAVVSGPDGVNPGQAAVHFDFGNC